MVGERLIGCEEPTKEDVEAIEKYEDAKRNKKLRLDPLSELTKGN
jgi:hypothetical protein